MPFLFDCYAGKKILITGHTGFKGSWLSIWLNRLQANICGYSNEIPTQPALFEEAGVEKHLRHELGDICDGERLTSMIRDFKPDFVFHLAAQAIVSASYSDPMNTFRVNVMGTATLLQALRGVDWPCIAVIITSDKAYDNVEWPWGYRETDALGGKDIYSGSKGAAELVFKSFFHSFFSKGTSPVRMATARAGNVIGGGDWAMDRIVVDCIRSWMDGRHVTIRSPKATRPWQHVLEPLSGYLTLAAQLTKDQSLHGENFNFGPRAEQNATVLELLLSLSKVWGFDNTAECFSMNGNSPFHEASLLKLNIDKALLRLRWEPTLTCEECIMKTGTWYRDVIKHGAPARELTNAQIEEYVDAARQRRRIWTL